MKPDAIQEFTASFWTYVRTTEGLVDTRDQLVRKYCELPIAEVVAFAESHDLAVMISGCVCVASPKLVEELSALDGDCLHGNLAVLIEANRLPLTTRPGHPVGGMLTALASHQDFCGFYLELAEILSAAALMPAVRMFLYGVDDTCIAPAVTDEEVVEASDAGEGEADGSEFPELAPDGYPTLLGD